MTYKNQIDKKNNSLTQPKELKKYGQPSKPAEKDTTIVKVDSVIEAVVKDTVIVKTDIVLPEAPAIKTEEPAKTPAVKEEEPAKTPAVVVKPVYRVQIFAASRVLKPGDASFKGLKNCKYTRDGNFYKYTYGETSDYVKAVELQKQIKAKFPDCFVVAFLDGKQISVKEARKM